MPVRNVTESEQSEVICFSMPIIASESKSSSSGPEIPRPRAARPALSSRSGHHGMFPRGPGHAASWGMAGRWDGMGEAVVVSKCKARMTHLIHMTLMISLTNQSKLGSNTSDLWMSFSNEGRCAISNAVDEAQNSRLQ